MPESATEEDYGSFIKKVSVLLSGLKLRHKKTGVVWTPIAVDGNEFQLADGQGNRLRLMSLDQYKTDFELIEKDSP